MLTQNSALPRRAVTTSAHAWEDQAQGAVDMLGLIPVLNVPAEVASAALSLRKKDYVGFGLSVAGMVPLAGEWAVALKIARALHQGAADSRTQASA